MEMMEITFIVLGLIGAGVLIEEKWGPDAFIPIIGALGILALILMLLGVFSPVFDPGG